MLFKRKHEDSEKSEKIKQELLSLIDESSEVIYKIAFYSQPEVQDIMNRLMNAWESSGRRGRPIDHASISELKLMLKIARKITKKKPEELWAEYGY